MNIIFIVVSVIVFVCGIMFLRKYMNKAAVVEEKVKPLLDLNTARRRRTMRSITNGLKKLEEQGSSTLSVLGNEARKLEKTSARQAHQERAAYVQKQMEETAKKNEYSTSKKEKMGRF